MAWDSTRPVQWRRLINEWLLYFGIASVLFVIFFLIRDKKIEPTLFIGLISSGPLYLLFGYVTAKFGYQRKTYRQLRNERQTATSARSTSSTNNESAARPKPAPTKRTSTGPSQYRKSSKPKRR